MMINPQTVGGVGGGRGGGQRHQSKPAECSVPCII